jgi:hypothetical protein
MYRADPRLSAFVMLALVALLRGTSGIFAYDLACGLVLAASILGVAAVFAKSRLTLILLICVLALSVWFEYGRSYRQILVTERIRRQRSELPIWQPRFRQ